MRFRVEPAVWRALLVSALPLGLALAINAVYFRADTLIISLYEPYAQVGLYTLAYRVLELTLVLGTILLNTTFPLLSEAVARDEPRARRMIELSTEVFVILGVPLIVGGLVLAPEVIELAGGEEFGGAAEPLRILLAAGALAWFNGVFGYALIAKERQASALWLNLSALVFNIGLNFLLVPRYGIVAAAVVTAGLRAADPGRLLSAHEALLRLLPGAAHGARGGGGRRRHGRPSCGCSAAFRCPLLVPLGMRRLRGGAVGDQPGEPNRADRCAPVTGGRRFAVRRRA